MSDEEPRMVTVTVQAPSTRPRINGTAHINLTNVAYAKQGDDGRVHVYFRGRDDKLQVHRTSAEKLLRALNKHQADTNPFGGEEVAS